MSARFHIACSANAAYTPHVAALLQSVGAVHGAGEVAVHFLHDATVSRDMLNMLRASAEKAGLEFHAHQPAAQQLTDIPQSTRYPQVAWYRVLLPDLLPDLDRVLYLDADTLVMQDIAPLWRIDLGDFPLAAIEDALSPVHAYIPAEIGLSSQTDYFNSGVLLMNLKAMRTQGFGETLMTIARKPHIADFADQVPLNMVCAGRWIHLHPKWNCMSTFIEDSDRAGEAGARTLEQRQAAVSPCVLHFEGYWMRGKPWHYRCDHPQQWLYLHYRALTPWPLTELEGRTWKNRVAKRIPRRVLDWVARFRR